MREGRREFLGLAVASGAAALLLAIVSVTGAVAAVPTITKAGRGPIGRFEETRLIESARLITSPATARNGRWIAFATHESEVGDASSPQHGSGSDVFVTRVGRRPKLVAGRGSHGAIWNECPAFSPNGRMLAFARVARGDRSTIVVVRIAPHGPMRAGRLVLKVPHGALACPRWSANGSRLAYLYRGKVVIRGLDGSRRPWSEGDPTIDDFNTSGKKIASPTGDLIAELGDSSIIISRPDGTIRDIIPDAGASYAIAGWSPDGRDLLLMKDVGGGFQMRVVSVDPPFVSKIVVDNVPVNTARSWPGYGDVSWQPIQ